MSGHVDYSEGDVCVDGSNISCGVNQLIGVAELTPSGFRRLLVANAYSATLEKGITYIFSDSYKGNGKKIASLIRKHKLGTIHAHSWVKNPSSGNMINVWTWTYNGRKIPKSAKL